MHTPTAVGPPSAVSGGSKSTNFRQRAGSLSRLRHPSTRTPRNRFSPQAPCGVHSRTQKRTWVSADIATRLPSILAKCYQRRPWRSKPTNFFFLLNSDREQRVSLRPIPAGDGGVIDGWLIHDLPSAVRFETPQPNRHGNHFSAIANQLLRPSLTFQPFCAQSARCV